MEINFTGITKEPKLDGQDASEFINKTDLDHLGAADGSPANAVHVDDGGNVDIGTNSPGAKLDVVGGGSSIGVRASSANSCGVYGEGKYGGHFTTN